MSALAKVRAILVDIRFEQTLFSLPFALLAAVMASSPDVGPSAWPAPRVLGFIVLALVAARSAAMAINRFADAFIDGRNPRTAGRAVPAGRVSRTAMGAFALVCTAIFLAAAAELNDLCLKLAPIALLFLIGYSWTKRFTSLCHLILGMTLGIAPLGAWVAVRGSLDDVRPWFLGMAVAAWVAGFDVIYACPDADVDQRDGLRSIPSSLGVHRAFRVSEVLHLATIALLAALGRHDPRFGGWWWGALAIGAGVLLAEHLLVRPGRYERMATAFFRLNAVFSTLLLVAGAASVLAVR
ncbi:MAG: putative 4-hydroxybenzoate polyprenyltransferase [Planctomycetes bacterium]|nr:putative 4-hydroxybenzoate polyprenyltransferase [Planctomycetota bacterium]